MNFHENDDDDNNNDNDGSNLMKAGEIEKVTRVA